MKYRIASNGDAYRVESNAGLLLPNWVRASIDFKTYMEAERVMRRLIGWRKVDERDMFPLV